MSGLKPPDYLSAEQIRLFETLADKVAQKRLTTPAILFLESVRPLNFVGSQAMLFFAPMIHAFFTAHQYDLIQQALERRETIAYLLDLLEIRELEMIRRDKESRERLKQEKRERREQKKQRRMPS